MIGYDIDGVLAAFDRAFLDKAKGMGLGGYFPPSPAEIKVWNMGAPPKVFDRVWNEIEQDEDWWLALPVEPAARPYIKQINTDIYITARPIPSEVSRQWLVTNGFPDAPVITTHDKVAAVTEHGVEFFIEDKHDTFLDINDNTAKTTCFLVTKPYNRKLPDGPWGSLRIRCIDEYILATTPKRMAPSESTKNHKPRFFRVPSNLLRKR